MSTKTTTEGSLTQHSFETAPGQQLYYWSVGNLEDNKPILIMQHGMRDVGRSLLPIAQALCDRFYCVMPDLRGHGKSFKPGHYAIIHFLMDLRQLQRHLNSSRIHLIGHSLGGHICANFSGIYPEDVETLTLIEGLGPPPAEQSADQPPANLSASLDRAITTAQEATSQRVLKDLATATERLLINNPGLTPQWAEQLARWGTQPAPNPGDGLIWSFDARAQEVFLGMHESLSFDFWRAVQARTLVVTGDLGHLYWAGQFPVEGYSGRFSDDQWQQRMTALSSRIPAQHQEIAGAGHQVHYDQPTALANVVRTFLLQS